MNLSYDKALYLLPFDHRQSYVSDMFHLESPLTVPQRDQVIDSKQLIYEGFRRVLIPGAPFDAAGILVDEQFGATILTLTRAEATTQIAGRLRECVDVFEAGRLSHPAGTA